jgi:UDP-glucose 4-epimerase
LAESLLKAGHELVVLDDLRRGNLENVAHIVNRLRFIHADIRDVGKHPADIGNVDVVIHLAALISGHDSLLGPVEYLRVNVEGTQALIDFAGEAGTKRFLFASSSTVYGNQPAGPISEDSAPAPLTVYALTKLVGEHLLRLYAPLRGYSHCSLRLFNVYGPRQAPDHPYANVTCKFSYAAANGLPVNLYGDGEQSRDFVYVADVVRAIMAVLDRSEYDIYNVGTGSTARITDLVVELERIAGRELEVEHCPPWPNDIRSIRADTSRFAAEFGFRPEVPLDEGLRRTVRFFREEASARLNEGH